MAVKQKRRNTKKYTISILNYDQNHHTQSYLLVRIDLLLKLTVLLYPLPPPPSVPIPPRQFFYLFPPPMNKTLPIFLFISFLKSRKGRFHKERPTGVTFCLSLSRKDKPEIGSDQVKSRFLRRAGKEEGGKEEGGECERKGLREKEERVRKGGESEEGRKE